MQKKKIISIIIFVIGLITLITGVTFLILDLVKKPSVADGEYLVEVGKWSLEDNDSVVWNFTEIGKGTLTTNNHINDYDFIWALEDNKLKIETKWLYDLEDEYEYKLNQDAKTLTLINGEETITFTAFEDLTEEK